MLRELCRRAPLSLSRRHSGGTPKLRSFTLIYHHTTPHAQTALLHHRRHQSSAQQLTSSSSLIDDLEDFEDVLLNGCAEGEPSSPTNAETAHDDAANGGSQVAASTPFDVQECAHSLLELLPADGSRIALTSLTSGVDLEAVADCCGSLLTMLETFPHWFRLEKISEKWFVGRRTKTGTQASSEVSVTPAQRHRTLPRGSTKLIQSDEFDRLAHIPTTVITSLLDHIPTEYAVSVAQLQSDHFGGANDNRGNGSIAAAASILEQQRLSLRFVLKHHPVAQACIRWPTPQTVTRSSPLDTPPERRSDVSPQELAASMRSKANVGMPSAGTIESPKDYPEDDWLVEIDLDLVETPEVVAAAMREEEAENVDMETINVTAADEGRAPSAPPPRAASPTPPSGVRRLAPPPPIVRSATSGRGGPSFTPLPPSVAQSLAVGKASAILVELLLECVPSFPVPSSQLRISDTLCKVLVTVPLLQLLRRFPRLFVVDNVIGVVHVKPTFTHANVGVADAKYEKHESEASDSAQQNKHRATTRVPFQSSVAVDEAMIRQLQHLVNAATRNSRDITTESATGLGEAITKGAFSKPIIVSDAKIIAAMPPPPTFAELLVLDELNDLWKSLSAQDASATLLLPTNVQRTLGKYKGILDAHHTLLWSHELASPQKDVVKLRPWWLSPSALDTTNAAASIMAPGQLEWLQKQVRPVWSPISRIVSKADVEFLAALSHLAGTSKTSFLKPGLEPENKDAVLGLALLGQHVWVSPCGTKIRRYCADPNLDDHVHLGVELLHASLPPVGPEASAGMVDLTQHIASLPFAKVLLRHPCEGATTTQNHEVGSDVESLVHFLERHINRFTIEKDDQSNKWNIGRFSAFRKKGPSNVGDPAPSSKAQATSVLFNTKQRSGWAAFAGGKK
ncbi:Hypothetical protein, putative [Bodo saltans]|uniref:Uncharacterized protein n=1 Tax=Bodo saltans TaxID=75058 RepID=A0A0S4JNM5_BODSA|nr:Hypothetical protein, putative [Bodo saltans]|eukprot:CUG91832.1 Hypothetical protein, putative [Bodo saltans]